jgi:hypothetical protein
LIFIYFLSSHITTLYKRPDKTIGTHPTWLRHVDAGIDTFQNSIGNLGEAFPILGGADSRDGFELGVSAFATHRTGISPERGEHILVGPQQIGVCGHLKVLVGGFLGHGLGGRFVIDHHGFAFSSISNRSRMPTSMNSVGRPSSVYSLAVRGSSTSTTA